MNKEEYLKKITLSNYFKSLDKEMQTQILGADESDFEFYMQMMNASDEAYKLVVTEFVEKNRLIQDKLKKEMKNANKDVNVVREKISDKKDNENLNNLINQLDNEQ